MALITHHPHAVDGESARWWVLVKAMFTIVLVTVVVASAAAGAAYLFSRVLETLLTGIGSS